MLKEANGTVSTCSSGTKMAMFVCLSERMQLYKAVIITPPPPPPVLPAGFDFSFLVLFLQVYVRPTTVKFNSVFPSRKFWGFRGKQENLWRKKNHLCQILYFFLPCVNQILTCERKRDAFPKSWCDCIFCGIFCSHTHSCFSLSLS